MDFAADAVEEIASMATLINDQSENIGARRLHTIMEKLLEDISYNIPEMEEESINIDAAYVREKFADRIHADDINRFIL